ncbi:CD99 antigen isoform X1 [Camelus bactrianus]|uniref:CD99 antigen isoform X1 n=1 Tax=Camelus bactrianus TaxID=9837 RepID=A0AC58PZY7_CAMBA
MARWAVCALLLVGLLGTLLPARGQDFDLSDALDDSGTKSTSAPKKPSAGDDFSLEDAIGGHNDPTPRSPPKPKPNPNPSHPGSSGGFSDSDLIEGNSGGGGGGGGAGGGGGDGGNQRHDGEEQGESQIPRTRSVRVEGQGKMDVPAPAESTLSLFDLLRSPVDWRLPVHIGDGSPLHSECWNVHLFRRDLPGHSQK